MKKVKFAVVSAVLIVTAALLLSATEVSSKPKFEIRKIEQQTVLYKIYRGPYEKSGQAAGKLFALTGQKGINPKGPVQYAYLNNPQYISKEHYLTEIRIPVDKDMLKLSGTLGEMTDIKMLSGFEMVIAKKSKGQTDQNSIYNDMYRWIYENQYAICDTPVEVFLSGAEGGDYSQMEAEIMMPVKKIEQPKK